MKLYAIGDWVARQHRGVSHLVESIVAGDVVTKCGRRMTDEPTKTGGRLVGPAPWPVMPCRVCIGPDQPEA